MDIFIFRCACPPVGALVSHDILTALYDDNPGSIVQDRCSGQDLKFCFQVADDVFKYGKKDGG
jgi:hypothetical protein